MSHIGFCYYHAAECFEYLGNYPKALQTIESGLSWYETTSFFWELKAEILQGMGRFEEAEPALAKAKEFEVNNEAK